MFHVKDIFCEGKRDCLIIGSSFNKQWQYSSCGKVMFSQACVKNSVHRGEGCLPRVGGGPCAQRGVCLGGLHAGGLGETPPTSTAYGQQAGGIHPTGMHSCFENVSKDNLTR